MWRNAREWEQPLLVIKCVRITKVVESSKT